MDIRGVEITNQLRSAIQAKLLELGVRYDDELPDYILVMVVNKKTRPQMNEDLNLFLEDSTEPFVDWLHDQVLKKLQKVTVAKKKSNKDPVPTDIVKNEGDKEKPKTEDQPAIKSDSPTREPTKVERDREFDELVGDLAMLNADDGKSDLKESEPTEEALEKVETAPPDSDSSDDSSPKSPERGGLHVSVSVPESTESDKATPNENLSENDKNESSHSLKRISDDNSSEKNDNNTSTHSLKRVSEDNLSEETVQSAKRSKISNDSDSENDDRVELSVSKPKITSVIAITTRPSEVSSSKKEESPINVSSGTQTVSPDRNEISSQRKKPETEDTKNDSRRDNKQSTHNSTSEKSSRIEESKDTDKERLSSRSVAIRSRFGVNDSKKEVTSLKSTNSTKVSKPRISNVKSRLGIRNKQQNREVITTTARFTKLSQKRFQEEDDDDVESVINTSLKSRIIAVQKPQKRKKTISESLDDILEVDIEDDDDDEDDECQVPSKVIVTPRPLKPLKPVQKRATQSLLLKAVAEANQSVVMQKKIDPCLKEQKKPTSKIKITRDPWKGKVVAVSLNGKNRSVMEKIQVELTNPDKSKSKKSHSTKKSKIVSDEDMDVVKSLFKKSDNKQKFLVTLNGYNNNVLKEKNSDDEEHFDVVELDDDDDELSLVNNKYDAYEDEVQILEHIETIDDQDDIVHTEYTNTHTDTRTDRHTDAHVDRRTDSHANRHTDTHTDRQKDTHTNRHTGSHTDKHADTRQNRRSDTHTDRRTDSHSDRRTDTHSDRRTDAHSDRRTDTHSDRRTDTHSDRRTDTHTDDHLRPYSERRADTQTNKYTNVHTDRRTDTYVDDYLAPYKERRPETHTDDHLRPYTERRPETQTNNHIAAHMDEHLLPYSERRAEAQQANKYTNAHTERRADPYIDDYLAPYKERRPEDDHLRPYVERRENTQTNNYSSAHTDRRADPYVDDHLGPYKERRDDTRPNKHLGPYTDGRADPQPSRYANKYTGKYPGQYIGLKNNRKENKQVHHLKVAESSFKNRRKLSPIIYSRSRSNSSEKRPRIASTVTSVLRLDKRPLISSIIKTVDKSSEKCRYWPNCTLGIKCAYSHPEVICSSFPACKFGEKCAYKHPNCKFGSACTKLGCKFSHPPVQCKYHPYCMKPKCQFSHPKTSTVSKLSQPLTPDMTTVRAKFTWKKKD